MSHFELLDLSHGVCRHRCGVEPRESRDKTLMWSCTVQFPYCFLINCSVELICSSWERVTKLVELRDRCSKLYVEVSGREGRVEGREKTLSLLRVRHERARARELCKLEGGSPHGWVAAARLPAKQEPSYTTLTGPTQINQYSD